MSKRDEVKIRLRTNLYDLLDDGVENNSDLEALRKAQESVGTPLGSSDVQPTHADEFGVEGPGSLTSAGILEPAPTPYRPHLAGAITGVLALAGGLWLLIAPTSALVLHDRMRYARPFLEHVTPLMSQVYGVALALVGVAFLYFSLRKDPPR